MSRRAAPIADMLRAELLTAVGADPDADVPAATPAGRPAADALRVAYRRGLLRSGRAGPVPGR